jgi:hypothetical protein
VAVAHCRESCFRDGRGQCNHRAEPFSEGAAITNTTPLTVYMSRTRLSNCSATKNGEWVARVKGPVRSPKA